MSVNKLFIYFLFIVVLYLLFEYINLDPILNNDNEQINLTLNNTNMSIRNLITEIKVYPTQTDLENMCGNEFKITKNNSNNIGCVSISMKNNNVTDAKIYVMSTQSYKIIGCNTFRNTLYHEIGHIDFAMKYGYESNKTIKEDYANNYANNFSKSNC